MANFASPRFLRNVLIADALSCAATGALQVLFTNPLQSLFALPSTLLAATGWFLVSYAALVGFIASRREVPHGLVWFIAAGNFAWTAGCVAVVFSAWSSLTVPGVLWIAAQAATTLVLGELQLMCVRRPGLKISG